MAAINQVDVVCPECRDTITIPMKVSSNGSVLDPFGGLLVSLKADFDSDVLDHPCVEAV